MEQRDIQVLIAVLLAGIVGFGLAALVLDNDDQTQPAADTGVPTVETTTPTTVTTETTPDPQPTGTTTTSTEDIPRADKPRVPQCVELWNQANNISPRTFLTDQQSRQAVRVNVGATAQAPARCLVTIIANNGNAFRFSEGGGQSFPYTAQPVRATLTQLTPDEREANALAEPDGTLSVR